MTIMENITLIEEHIKTIQTVVELIVKTAYETPELNDHRLTLINNAKNAIHHNLMIIKGATEKLK